MFRNSVTPQVTNADCAASCYNPDTSVVFLDLVEVGFVSFENNDTSQPSKLQNMSGG